MSRMEKNAEFTHNRTTSFLLTKLKEDTMGDLDEEQRALIPHAQREVTLHCIYKGLELGPSVILGTAFPYQYYRLRKTLPLRSILSRVGTISIYGTMASVLLSVLMMHRKFFNENYDQYRIWDRAYRLRYSSSQQRTDRFALASSILGGLTGLFIGLPTKMSLLSAGKGALMAVPLGILAHLLTASIQQL